MRLRFWKRNEPATKTVEEALADVLEVYRAGFLLVRNDYGDTIAWQKGKDRAWSGWRYARRSPENVYFADPTIKQQKEHLWHGR